MAGWMLEVSGPLVHGTHHQRSAPSDRSSCRGDPREARGNEIKDVIRDVPSPFGLDRIDFSAVGALSLAHFDGVLAYMVREASVQAEELALPPAAPFTEADQQMLAAICNRNGIEFVGPPID